MVVTIRKASTGKGFDIQAPEGFEDRDDFNVLTLPDALTKAAVLAQSLSDEIGSNVEISDEHESQF